MQFKDRLKIGAFESNKTVFFLGSRISEELPYPVIGLQVGSSASSSLSFLENLVINNQVNKLEYTFDYLSSSKGRIIFGGNDKLKRKPDFSIELDRKYHIPFVFSSREKIYLGEEQLEMMEPIAFDESFGFIQFPSRYLERIMTTLFGSNGFGYCTLMEHRQLLNKGMNLYTYLLCNKTIIQRNWKAFPKLRFEFTQGALILKQNDLLMNYNESQMLLMIMFNDYTTLGPSIIIGEPILKHFTIVHQCKDKGRLLFISKDSFSQKIISTIYSIAMSMCSIGICYLLLIRKQSLPTSIICLPNQSNTDK